MTSLNRFYADRALGACVGLAVGDALGSSLEFSSRDSRPLVTDMMGGGPFKLKPGEWTDDTGMALCLADSLIENRDLVERDLMERFVAWWRRGENSVTGRCFDVGGTTMRSLAAFERTGELPAGPDDPMGAGNGSLMRLAPAAVFAGPNLEIAQEMAVRQSRTTHPAPVAGDACKFFSILLLEAFAGRSKSEILQARTWSGTAEIAGIASGNWATKERARISSSGYVVSTLEAALWCVGQSDNFEDALVLAVNLADDADTVGAVTGQLAGALWGHSAIPGRWLSALAWRETIEARAQRLLELSKMHQR